MKTINFTAYIFLLLIVAALSVPPYATAQDAQYSASNPPPASFVFAGPVGGVSTAAGDEALLFRFIAVIHSLAPSRIQIVNVQTGEVLVDDKEPKLQPTPYKHPSRPSIPILKWEGRSVPEAITDSMPSWLHESGTTHIRFEIRVTSSDGSLFSLTQPASFGAPLKNQLKEAAAFNRKNFPKAKDTISGPSNSKPTVVPTFDFRPWKVGYENGNERQRITEYVLPDQTVDSWRELFTRQEYFFANNRVSLERLVARIREGFGPDCKSFQWDVLRSSEAETVYQWTHEGCRNYPPQFEIAKLNRTEKGICRWAYATKETPVSASSRLSYMTVIDKLQCE